MNAIPEHQSSSSAIDRTALQRAVRSNFFIHRLHLDARLGLCDWERATPQPITVDLEFQLPNGLSCLTDRLEHTIDHRHIVERLRGFASNQHHDLVEALAENIAQLLQSEFAVPWVNVSVTKQRPFPATEVGVTLERGARQS